VTVLLNKLQIQIFQHFLGEKKENNEKCVVRWFVTWWFSIGDCQTSLEHYCHTNPLGKGM